MAASITSSRRHQTGYVALHHIRLIFPATQSLPGISTWLLPSITSDSSHAYLSIPSIYLSANKIPSRSVSVCVRAHSIFINHLQGLGKSAPLFRLAGNAVKEKKKKHPRLHEMISNNQIKHSEINIQQKRRERERERGGEGGTRRHARTLPHIFKNRDQGEFLKDRPQSPPLRPSVLHWFPSCLHFHNKLWRGTHPHSSSQRRHWLVNIHSSFLPPPPPPLLLLFPPVDLTRLSLTLSLSLSPTANPAGSLRIRLAALCNLSLTLFIHTHTHTHTYIYIYMLNFKHWNLIINLIYSFQWWQRNRFKFAFTFSLSSLCLW